MIQINIHDVPDQLEDPDRWWKRVETFVDELLPLHKVANCVYDPEGQPRLTLEVVPGVRPETEARGNV